MLTALSLVSPGGRGALDLRYPHRHRRLRQAAVPRNLCRDRQGPTREPRGLVVARSEEPRLHRGRRPPDAGTRAGRDSRGRACLRPAARRAGQGLREAGPGRHRRRRPERDRRRRVERSGAARAHGAAPPRFDGRGRTARTTDRRGRGGGGERGRGAGSAGGALLDLPTGAAAAPAAAGGARGLAGLELRAEPGVVAPARLRQARLRASLLFAARPARAALGPPLHLPGAAAAAGSPDLARRRGRAGGAHVRRGQQPHRPRRRRHGAQERADHPHPRRPVVTRTRSQALCGPRARELGVGLLQGHARRQRLAEGRRGRPPQWPGRQAASESSSDPRARQDLRRGSPALSCWSCPSCRRR